MKIAVNSLSLEEIIELPAVNDAVSDLSKNLNISIAVIDPKGKVVFHERKSNNRIQVSVSKGKKIGDELFTRIAETIYEQPYDIKEITLNGMNVLVSKLLLENKVIGYLVGGSIPLQDDRDRKNSDFDVDKRNIRAFARILTQLYIERYQSRQNVSRISTLYKLGNTVNSSLKLVEVMRLVLDSTIELLGAQAGSIMLLDEKTDEMRIFVAYGLSEEIIKTVRVKLGEGISGTVAKTGEPRLLLKGVKESKSLSEKKEIPSAMCVPLKVKDKVIGVLNISGKVSGDNFLREDLELLQIMASNCAGAIHNAHLYLNIEEKAKELEALYGIGTTITSSMDKKKVLHEVLISSRKLLKAKKGSIMLLDKDKSELRIEVAYGLSRKIKQSARPKLGEGIAGKVALEGQPRLMEKGIRVSDSKSEKEAREIPSAICVPVKIKEKIIGVINVSEHENGDNFTKASVDLLMMLANQAAIALENARLLQDLQELFDESITALANAIDARDPYTRGHSQRVTEYSIKMAKKMDVTWEEAEYIKYAALLHDIGKIHIRDDILNKPGKLTDEEFEEMQKHPVYGAKILEPVKRFKTILPYMFHHHEKYAGKGYPNHLSGEEIPLAARIITIADSFDAMTSDRPYRKGLSIEAAANELKRNSGTQFDPEIVEIFMKIINEDKYFQPENFLADMRM